ncbi:TPA: hypothetical protein I7117_14855 [Vibrio vulnificus]|nr:hypothetical protein [Vibrio vulnificus]
MNNVKNRSVSIGVASIFLFPIVVSDYGYAGVKQPFNPAQYDKVITAPNDKTEFISIGHDDSMGAREFESIGAPVLPPTPVDPGEVVQPDPEPEPEIEGYTINCGSLKYINEVYSSGSDNSLPMELQLKYLGEELFAEYYGKSVSTESGTEYIVTYDKDSQVIGVTLVGGDGTSLNIDHVNDIEHENIIFTKPIKNTANPSCRVYAYYPSRSYIATYFQINSCGSYGCQGKYTTKEWFVKAGANNSNITLDWLEANVKDTSKLSSINNASYKTRLLEERTATISGTDATHLAALKWSLGALQ